MEGDDVTVSVSSPATYIQSHDTTVPTIVVSSADDMLVSGCPAVFNDSIQPSDIKNVTATPAHANPSLVPVNLTSSLEMPPFEVTAPRYPFFRLFQSIMQFGFLK